MLGDFKEQGSTDEQLKEMATEANYEKYKVRRAIRNDYCHPYDSVLLALFSAWGLISFYYYLQKIARPLAEKTVLLSMAFRYVNVDVSYNCHTYDVDADVDVNRDIAEKESVAVSADEIKAQLDLLTAQVHSFLSPLTVTV